MSISQMFGLIVSGRLVQTDAQQVSEKQILFNIPDADNINHVVVFMTGQTPFPDGIGGAVYFSWPSPLGQNWMLLGFITNDKPSAIFKITNFKTADINNSSHPFGQMEPQTHLAQIGISAEPLDQLAQLTPSTFSTTATVEPFVEFSKKMCENLFNFAGSFAVTQQQMAPNLESYVPLNKIQLWFQNFLRKLEQNPYFWRT